MPKKKTKLQKEIQEIEQWVTERKKFFIKLSWVVGLILALVIISNIYLKLKG